MNTTAVILTGFKTEKAEKPRDTSLEALTKLRIDKSKN